MVSQKSVVQEPYMNSKENAEEDEQPKVSRKKRKAFSEWIIL
jgi:hypothetical protein